MQVGLLELVAGLERFVKDSAGEQITHLQADQRLAATGGRRVHLHVKTVEGRAVQFEKHFALDVNGIDQCGHGFLRGVLNVAFLGYQGGIFLLTENVPSFSMSVESGDWDDLQGSSTQD